MQNDFVGRDGSLRVPDAKATIPAIGVLLGLARTHGMHVINSQDTYRTAIRNGASGASTVARAAGVGRSSTPSPRRRTTPWSPRFATTPFYGTPLDHFLRLWGVETLVICGTVANICVHYTAASAALRWYGVVIPRDAISALDPFDVESSLRQTAFLFAGRVTTAAGVRV
jgi:nicotinamidase-related amidase